MEKLIYAKPAFPNQVCKSNCVKDNFDVAEGAVAAPFKRARRGLFCGNLEGELHSLLTKNNAQLRDSDAPVLQRHGPLFSMFRVARYISLSSAISEVKAPLVLVTLRIWR